MFVNGNYHGTACFLHWNYKDYEAGNYKSVLNYSRMKAADEDHVERRKLFQGDTEIGQHELGN